MARRKGKSGGNSLSVDFTGVDVKTLFPEDEYYGTLSTAKHDTEKGDHGKVVFNFEITRGKLKGKVIPLWCDLGPSSLWKLRNTLEAMGIDTPASKFEVDLDAILEELGDTEFGLNVTVRTYNNKMTNDVEVFPAEEGDLDDDDDDDDEDSDDAGEEDLPSEDEIKEMDEDELQEVVDDFDLDVELDEVKGRGKKKLAAQQKVVIEALAKLNDDDDEDDDDDNEDLSYTAEEINSANAKRLTEIVEEAELDVELEGSLRKKRKAVKEALEEEDLLDE